jgi:hypothetical protein
MENKRPLAPGFINKVDKYLLLNKPDTWTARTHLVLYYSLLFIIVLSAICFLVHDDPRQSSPSFIWGFFTGVLALVGFIVWLIYLLRFNVFKRFGVVEKGDNLKTFILYFFSVGIMAATIFIPPAIETIKANHAYGDEEITKDVNEMNLSICKLNKSSLPVKWDGDTCLVRNNVRSTTTNSDAAQVDTALYNDKGQQVYNGHGSNYYIIDTAEADRKKFETDSTVKINDSLYVFYKCPNYDFVTSYENYYVNSHVSDRYYSISGILSSVDIYKQVFKNPAPFNKDKLQARLQFLIKKYKVIDEPSDYVESDNESSYTYRINKKYGLSYVIISITNITDRKYRWHGYAMPIIIRFYFYTTLVLSLLVFIFRHSTARTFFLSLLAGIILIILTSLFLALINTTATGTFICFLVYFGIFLTLSSTIYFNKARKVINGIGLNFTVFFVAFIPVLITALYYQLLRDADDSRRHAVDIYEVDLTKYANENMHYMFAEIIGFVVLLVLIETVFKKLYRTWYALPEA